MYIMTQLGQSAYLTTEGRALYPTRYFKPETPGEIIERCNSKKYMENVRNGIYDGWRPLTRTTQDATVYTPHKIELQTENGYIFGPRYTFHYSEMKTNNGILAIAEATQDDGRGIEKITLYPEQTTLRERAATNLGDLYTDVYREHYGRSAADYTPPTPPELTEEQQKIE